MRVDITEPAGKTTPYEAPTSCTCGVTVVGWSRRTCRVYNEQAFRYFLRLEGAYGRHTDRAPLLVALHLAHGDAAYPRMTDDVSAQLFVALGECTRELDFIGWFRHERVVAAAFTECASTDHVARALLLRRVSDTLRLGLPTRLFHSVRLHSRFLAHVARR